MSKKAKLSQLHKELASTGKGERGSLKENAKTEIKPDKPKRPSEANPARGERGSFLKVTITLPPNMLASLKKLGIERKLLGVRDSDVSSLIREAVDRFLNESWEK